jgi:single-stranded DNA-binding protein
LAINAGSRTTWHKVVVFDEAATKLAGQLHRGDVRKGRLVEVTGQTVVREDPTPKGVKTTTEFHATAVSRVKPSRPGSSPPAAR